MILKRKEAFSLVEMLVTMAIFAIMTVMLMQSLLLNIQLSGKINARSQIRTELDEVTSLIERDIRNADYVGVCNSISCIMSVGGEQIQWSVTASTPTNPGKIIKRNVIPNVIVYQTSTLLDYKTLDFFVNTQQNIGTTVSLANIFVTIKADAAFAAWRDEWKLANQIRQISVSTRNYYII